MSMDPYYEQRLRDEVIYLHSLWHQGPPTNSNPNPNPNPNLHASRHLHPSHPTQFKKETTVENPGFKKRKKRKKRPPESDPPPVSDLEWPCQSPADAPSASASGWPTLKPSPTPSARLPSAEEQARFAATQSQHTAMTAARDFFAANVDSDGDEDDDSNDEDDLMGENGYEEYQFFLNLFTRDGELRGYYERKWEGGEFFCLVCCGIGKKMGKRFKNCVALVQHSVSVAKTKKKLAHRAYAQVMCKVLGWNIDRLPSIVLALDDPLGRSLAKPIECQGNAEVGIGDSSRLNKDSGLENVNSGELILKELPEVGQREELQNSSVPGTSNAISDNVMLCEGNAEDGIGDSSRLNKDSGLENVNSGDLILKELPEVGQEEELQNSSIPGTSNAISDNVMLCENSLKVGDANKCLDNADNGGLNLADRNTEEEVNCLERDKDTGAGNIIFSRIVVVNDLEGKNGHPD